MIGPTCPKCGHIHPARDVVALSRFVGVTGYRAGGKVYETREDAQAALCAERAGEAS